MSPKATHPALCDRPTYLDYNATTPVDPRVADVITSFLVEEFGNPSSTHAFGRGAHTALGRAREQVRDLIGAGATDRIVFTGSGSEADHLAIIGTVLGAELPSEGAHVITQATEHPAVLAACAQAHDLHGVDVTILPVDREGLVDPEAVAAAMTASTVLVSVMHANNETGTIQPVAEIARIVHEHGALLHCDAAQSVGKIPVDVNELGADLLTVVGHKMYAPKGVAALHVADGVRLRPLVGGGGQEYGLRAGTENVAYAVGLGQAAQLAAEALAAGESARLQALRDRLQEQLIELIPGPITLNGHPIHRLPNTLNISIAGVRALTLLSSGTGVAASAGSACHAGEDSPSPVLTAMGVPADQALGALRLSLGRWTTTAEVDEAAHLIARTAKVEHSSTDIRIG